MKVNNFKKCRNCGELFKIYNSLQKFCSPSCMRESGNVKNIKKISRTQEKENAIFKINSLLLKQQVKLKYKKLCCEMCKTDKSIAFSVHHIIYRSERPRHKNLHDLKNLLFLCHDCHEKLHDHKALREGIIQERELNAIFKIERGK